MSAGKSLAGITTGTLLGIFSLGMFFPWANSKGALTGGLVSTALLAWLSLGSQTAIARGQIVFPTKPVSVEGCPHALLNRTLGRAAAPSPLLDEPLAIYRVSYMWYSLIGTATTLAVGMLVSWLTGFTDPGTVDRDLLTPVIHRFLPPREKPQVELRSRSKT